MSSSNPNIIWNPDPLITIPAATSGPVSATITAVGLDDETIYTLYDFTFLSASGVGGTVLQGGAQVLPGVLIQPPDGGGSYPTLNLEGTVSGTPTAAGTYSVYVRARAWDGASSFLNYYKTYTVSVSGPALSLTPPSSGTTHTLTAGNSGAGYASEQITVLNGTGNYTISLSYLGLLPNWISLNTSTASNTQTTVLNLVGNAFYLVSTRPLTDADAGTWSFFINVTDNGSGSTTVPYQYTIVVSTSGGGLPLSINLTGCTVGSGSTSLTLTNLRQAVNNTVTYNATGGSTGASYLFSITAGSLPAGLVLTNLGNSCSISGVPTGFGAFAPFTIGVQNANELSETGALFQTYTIDRNIEINGTAGNGQTNTSYTAVLTGIGGSPSPNYTWSIISGIPGLAGVASGTGSNTYTISGTPTSVNTYTLIVRCSDGVVQKDKSFTVVISSGSGGGGLTFNPNGGTIYFTQKVAATNSISISGGIAPYTWSVASGTLPSGITLAMSGGPSFATYQFAGTAAAYAGFSPLNITVTDSTPGTALTLTKAFSTYVYPNIIYKGSSTLPQTGNVWSVGTPISLYADFEGADNTGYTYQLSNAPTWMALTPGQAGNTRATISGTPNNAQTATTFTINVTAPTSSGSVTVPFTFAYTVTGTSILITPFTTNMCANSASGNDIVIGARSITGPGGPYTYNLSSSQLGSFSPAGPYSANQIVTYNPAGINGTHTITFTCVQDGSSTAVTTLTTSGATTVISSMFPAGPLYKHAGEQNSIGSSFSGGCSANDKKGFWDFVTTGDNGSLSDYFASLITYIAPSTVSAVKRVLLRFNPFEGLSGSSTITIYLLPGSSSCALTIASPANPLPTGTVSSLYTPQTFTTTGASGIVTWSILAETPLPDGLSLNSVTGELTGTPTIPGVFRFAVIASDAGGCYDVKEYQITINGGVGATLSTITPNTFLVGSGGTRTVTINGTGFLAGDIFRITKETSNVDCAEVSLNATTFTGTVPTWIGNQGLADLLLVRSAAVIAVKTDAVTFAPDGSALSISSFTPTSATADRATPLTITVTGSGFDATCVVKYRDNPLLGGGVDNTLSTTFVSANQLTASIPASFFVAGTYAGTVAQIKVTKSATTVTAGTNFSVTAGVFSIATACPLATATRSAAYSTTVTATGGVTPYAWSIIPVDGLPAGLSIDSGTGVISGTTGAGAVTGNFTIRCTDANTNIVEKTCSIPVVGGAISIDTNTLLPDARIAVAYSKQIVVTGGTAPYTFTRISGNIPQGLTLGLNDGILSGTPSSQPAPETFTFSLRVTDAAAVTADKTFTLSLLPALSAVVVSTATPSAGPVAGGTSVTIAGSGFQNGATVKFGNAVGINTVYVDANTITSVSPPATIAGLVDIIVTNPDTGSGTKTGGFEYRNITSPVIDSMTVTDGPFAGGTEVTLLGSNFNGTTGVRFGITDTPSTAFSATIVEIDTASTPQRIKLLVPAYPLTDGSVAVAVSIFATNNAGTGTLSPDPVGWYYRPAPVIVAITPNTAPTTGGTTIYITGRNYFERNGVKPRVFIGSTEVPSENITLVED